MDEQWLSLSAFRRLQDWCYYALVRIQGVATMQYALQTMSTPLIFQSP